MARYRKPYTLTKRGKVYYYRTYDEQGYRTSAKTTGCTSKIAAIQYCESLYLNKALNVTRSTFKEYAQGFFNRDSPYVIAQGRKLSVNTAYHYQCILKSRLIPYFGNMPLSDIHYSTLITFQSELLKTLSDKRVNVIMSALTHIFKVATRDHKINYNPMTDFEYANTKLGKKRIPYTREEIKAIYNNMPTYKDFWLFLALTGMRVSEAIGIQDEDFVMFNDQLCINLQHQWDYRTHQYLPCKGGSSRVIPVIPEVRELILPFLPYTTFRSAILTASKNANVTDKTLHCLRHYMITDMKMKLINPYKVEYIAGHKFPGIEQIYTHVRVTDMPEILNWQKELFNFVTK